MLIRHEGQGGPEVLQKSPLPRQTEPTEQNAHENMRLVSVGVGPTGWHLRSSEWNSVVSG